MRKTILFVAFSNSIHTSRWINQLTDLDWDLHLFPSEDIVTVHPDLKDITVHHSFYGSPISRNDRIKLRGFNLLSRKPAFVIRSILQKIKPDYRARQLSRLIARLNPDIVHTMEMQTAGYLTLAAKKHFSGNFPPWIVTNWGSDIYLFGKLKEHQAKINELLSVCNYYSCESERDVSLARRFGFSGVVLPVFPNSGGFDLNHLSKIREKLQKPSDRKCIMLKGYQGWAGRSLVAIRALSKLKEQLKGYTVIIYTYQGIDVKIAAELLSYETGIEVRFLPEKTSHDEILQAHGMARISIGLSISDAISTSVLEAMAMGSFPIQSWTSTADEWYDDGISGLLVPPEDPEDVAKAVEKALIDDNLVDNACEINWNTIKKRLDYNVLKEKTINLYKSIV